MKTNHLNFNGRELPAYLGYGILDEKSIKFENDVLKANYVFECDGSVVHQVSWEKERCNLDTFFHGKPEHRSCYPDLKKVLLTDCMYWRLDKDECFNFVSGEICNLGNIYVEHPKPNKKNTTINYFPAGKLFLFSLPVLEKTTQYLDFLKKEIDHVSFFRERKSVLLLATNDSKIQIKPILIADFIVPLAYLVSAANSFVSSNIISKEKHLRLMVNESWEAENSFMQVFPGDKFYPNFAIFFREFPEDKYSALAEIFNGFLAERNK